MNIANVHINELTYSNAVRKMQYYLSSDKDCFLITPNIEILLDAMEDEQYAKLLDTADISVPDGIGVFLLYQAKKSTLPTKMKYCMLPYWCIKAFFFEELLHKQFGERITGADLTQELLGICEKEGYPIVVLDQKVTEIQSEWDQKKQYYQKHFCAIMEELYPHIRAHIVLIDETSDPIEQVRNLDIQNGILFSTIGGKWQQILARRILNAKVGIQMAAGVGGSIDIVTGFRQPAPSWMRKRGLEWLYRLIKRPKRHLERIKNVIRGILIGIGDT